MRTIYFEVVHKIKKNEDSDMKKLKAELNRMKIILRSHEESSNFFTTKIEQEEIKVNPR